MPKRNHISESEILKIEEMRKKNKDKTIDKRLYALILHAAGEKRASISEKTGFSKQYITVLVRKYLSVGLEEYSKKHHRGNHRNISIAEEAAILEPFKKAAEAGQIVEVGSIREAYEQYTGRSLENNRGQIYNVLKRHGWRKILPRSKHPNKASDEVIESSKKLI